MSIYHEEQIAKLNADLRAQQKGNGKLYAQLKDASHRIGELQAEIAALKADRDGPRVKWSGRPAKQG